MYVVKWANKWYYLPIIIINKRCSNMRDFETLDNLFAYRDKCQVMLTIKDLEEEIEDINRMIAHLSKNLKEEDGNQSNTKECIKVIINRY